MKNYYEAMVKYRKELMERIWYETGDKREGLIEAMCLLTDIEAAATGVDPYNEREE